MYAQSSLPQIAGTLPRYFSLDGAGNTSGFVQSGTSYDFDSSSVLLGGGYISSDGWLANDTVMQPDYYAIMYKRFGSPATSDYPGGTILTSPPTSRSTPYYVTGDLTISTSAWNMTAGQRIIVIVTGDIDKSTPRT